MTVAQPFPLALEGDPLDVFTRLAREPGALYLEVPDPERPTVLLSCRPTAELRIDTAATDPLRALATFVAETPAADSRLPFPLGGGVVACLTYELGAVIAPRRVPHAGKDPLAVLRRYDPFLLVGPEQRHVVAARPGSPRRQRSRGYSAWATRLRPGAERSRRARSPPACRSTGTAPASGGSWRISLPATATR